MDSEVKDQARSALVALAGGVRGPNGGGVGDVGGAAAKLMHDLAQDAGLLDGERARTFRKRKTEESFVCHAQSCECVRRIATAFRDCDPQDHVTRALLVQFVHDVPLEQLNPPKKKEQGKEDEGKEGEDARGLGFVGLGWKMWNRVRQFVETNGITSHVPVGEGAGRPALDSTGPDFREHEALLKKIRAVWYKHSRVAAGGAGIGLDARVLTHSRRYVAAQCDKAGLCSMPTARKSPKATRRRESHTRGRRGYTTHHA